MQVDDVHQLIGSLMPFARLRFPMESAEDVARQLPGGLTRLRLEGAEVDLRAVLRRVPAHYFPISSLENLLAKGRAIFEENEHRIGVPTEVAPILRQVGGMLDYPVTHVGQLQHAAETAGVSSVRVGGRSYALAHLLQAIEHDALPIANVRELYRLARRLSRPQQTAGVGSRRQQMSTGKKPLVMNKAAHAHGDVIAATGRVVRAESGYKPRIVDVALTPVRKAHATTTNMRASLAKPTGKS